MDEPQITQTPSAHDALRSRLVARYGIQGEYVGCPAVARILGLGRTTVHDQIKEGRFPLPCRYANRKPLILLDDLVAWMLGDAEPVQQAPSIRRTAPISDSLTFKHADAEEAFLQLCARRGLAVPTLRR